jgi:opacity protein-like surface antigen
MKRLPRISRSIITLGAFAAAFAASQAVEAQVYYRGEVGYSQSFGADFKDKDPNAGLICGDAACSTGGSLDNFGGSAILSGGIGYRFTPNLRGDVTLGYRPSYQLNASDKGVPATKFSADVTSLALMVNGYYDLPLQGWTPYVGAGLGYAQNKIGSVSFNDGAGFIGTAPGGTKSGTAWALMLGAAIPAQPGVTLDFGYRFIDLGKVESAAGDVSVSGFTVPGYGGAAGKLKANELFVGIRF